MNRWLSVTVASLMLSVSLGLGFSSLTLTQVNHTRVIESQEADVAVISAPSVNAATDIIVEVENPKLCKDEAGLPKECENSDWMKVLGESLGGMKGMTGLAIALAVSQFLLFFLLSPAGVSLLPFLAVGQWKLTIAYGLHLISGVIGLMVSAHLDLGAALVHANTLAMGATFGNQVFKQFFVKKS